MTASFAATLRQFRMERGLSQRRLADLAFYDHSTITRWEGGTRFPTREGVDMLIASLGLSNHDGDRLHNSAGYVPTRIMDRRKEAA